MTINHLFSMATSAIGWKTGAHDIQYQIFDADDKYGHKRVLAFQGTDVDFDPKTWRFRASLKDLLIDAGFLPAFGTHGWPLGLHAIFPEIERIYAQSKPVDYITGWSLGGMIAQALYPFHRRIVTFGSPRVVPRICKPTCPDSQFHIVHSGDGLIDLYPAILYKRSGMTIKVGEGTKRFRTHNISAYAEAIEDEIGHWEV